MEDRQAIIINDFLGLNTRVSELALPPGASPSLLNIDFKQRGWTVRQGYQTINAVSTGANINGIFQGFNHLLVAYAGKVSSLSGDTLTERKTGLTSGAHPSFSSYNALDMMVNGSTSDNPQSWDGTTWQDLAGSPPKADHICVWRNHVWLTGLASPNQGEVRFSELEVPTVWPSGHFLRPTKRERGATLVCSQVVPFPGEEDGTRLCVFAQDRIYNFDGFNKVLFQIYQVKHGVGSVNAHCHVNADNLHYWLDEAGFYATPNACYDVNQISWNINPTIARINWAQIALARGVHDRNAKCILWAVPIDSATYNNAILVYYYGLSTPMTPSNQEGARHVWSLWQSNLGGSKAGGFGTLAEVGDPNVPFGAYLVYIGEGNATTNGGYVYKFGSFGLDNGTVIAYQWDTPHLLLQQQQSRRSVVRKVNLAFDGLSVGGTETMNVEIFVDGSGSSAQTVAMTLATGTTSVRNEDAWFNRIVQSARFRFSGVSGLATPIRCLEIAAEFKPLRGTK